MDVLGDGRGFAVRHAVFPQIAFPEICRHHLKRAAAANRLRKSRATTLSSASAARCDRTGAVAELSAHSRRATSHSRSLPLRSRETLPGLFARRLFGRIEIQQARLRA